MKINALTSAFVLPVLFVAGIGITSYTGYWRTESSKIPAIYAEGLAAGEYNPADIRGSYTLQDVENTFSVSVSVLTQAFGLSGEENPGSIQIKTFEDIYGALEEGEIGTDSMRWFVALYLDRPYTPEETTLLPRPAYGVLKNEGILTSDELESMEGFFISLDFTGREPAGTVDEAETLEVKGRTLFSELLDAGLTEDQIVEALGGIPMGSRSMSVRDYCGEQGIEFSGVKENFQNLLNN